MLNKILLKNFSQISFVFALKMFNQLIIFSFIAHIFSIEEFGFIGFSITISTIVANIIDYGYRLKVVKDIAGNEIKNIFSYFHRIFLLKIIFSIFSLLLILIYFLLRDFTNYELIFFSLLIISSSFISFSNLFASYFQAKKNFKIELFSNFILSFSLFLYLILIFFYKNFLLLSVFYLIGSVGMFIYSFNIFLKKNQFLLKKFFSYKKSDFFLLKKEIIEAFPFSVHVIISTFFANIDIVFVENFCNRQELGIYQAFIKIIFGMTIFSSIASTFLMPLISEKINNFKKSFHNKLVFYNRILIGIFIFSSIIFYIFSDFFIKILFGKDFLEINKILFYIIFIVFSKYFALIPSIIITSSGNQMQRVKALLFVLILNIILYFIFVPYGFIYAIKITTFGNFITSILYLFFSFKIIKSFLIFKK